MQHSEKIGAISIALVAAQSELEHAHKNATNPHFKNRYADLTEVIDTVRPVLAKHQLAVLQFPGYADGVTTLETVLLHVSGEWISGTAGARMQKDDPQGVGSALTYLRRYSLAAVCGISQDDDDGEAASVGRVSSPQRSEARPVDAVGSTVAAPGPYEQRPSARDGFSLDEVAGSATSKAKERTYRELLTTEEGRGFIKWQLDKVTTLSPQKRTALTEALATPKADTVKAILVQDAVNRAASAGVITDDQERRINASIEKGDADELNVALDWLRTMMAKKEGAQT